MRYRQIFDNLRFKVTAGIILPLAVILGLFSYVQYTRHRELEITLLEQSATNLGQIVEGSLRHAMLEWDFAELQQIINDVAQSGDVEGIVLMSPEGEVRFAPSQVPVGARYSESDPGCLDCHGNEVQPQTYSAIVTTAAGKRVMRNCNPVQNDPACTRCHDPENRVNGVIITDVSVAQMDSHLGRDLRSTLILFVGALLSGVLGVSMLMNQVVVSRLTRFAQAIKIFAQGDFGQRISLAGSDELANLAEMFNEMAQGLQEKARLERTVRQQADELRRLSEERGYLLEKTISAQEEERKRIARELHDEWAQTLAVLTVNLDQASKALPDEMVREKEQLRRTHAVTVDAVKALRQLILDLRPSVLDGLGLVPAIRWYAEAHLEANGIGVDFSTTGTPRRLSTEVETALFRITQEAINNIKKHAGATHATIRLEFQADGVVVSIEDDGRGFDVEQTLRADDETRGLGLLGMRERSSLVGGSLRISSRPGDGTQIGVRVPTDREGTSDG